MKFYIYNLIACMRVKKIVVLKRNNFQISYQMPFMKRKNFFFQFPF